MQLPPAQILFNCRFVPLLTPTTEIPPKLTFNHLWMLDTAYEAGQQLFRFVEMQSANSDSRLATALRSVRLYTQDLDIALYPQVADPYVRTINYVFSEGSIAIRSTQLTQLLTFWQSHASWHEVLSPTTNVSSMPDFFVDYSNTPLDTFAHLTPYYGSTLPAI